MIWYQHPGVAFLSLIAGISVVGICQLRCLHESKRAQRIMMIAAWWMMLSAIWGGALLILIVWSLSW